MIAFRIGARFPELAGAIVLEDPPWWQRKAPPEDHLRRPENPLAWAKDLPHQTLEELMAGYRRDHPTWTEEFLRTMCESKKQLDPAAVDIMAEDIHSRESDWMTIIPNLSLPMLLFVGNPALGGIVTPEVVAKVRELNPRVTIVHVPDAGHLIRFDKYAVFMEALRAFLDGVST